MAHHAHIQSGRLHLQLDQCKLQVIFTCSRSDKDVLGLQNRLWRKNRRPIDNSTCIGVDSNRNFDSNFGGIGSDSNPCSETYAGPAAFSEAESRAMRDVLQAHSGRVKAAVSIHSNAQLWISPYGFTTERPADYAEMVTANLHTYEATKRF